MFETQKLLRQGIEAVVMLAALYAIFTWATLIDGLIG
ncbi:hypothetical protein OCH7691_02270 [Oceanibacterium hippocampi]|uniref:Uncharacterized protein n=1 Tax=Oceanibacterium hippocampi TaxID=745714 RepID=A0A1Y5T1K7_9PROT|nr:hypothetical protein OCH7691_02270 [Oceanibacterium hippocampi]